MNITVIGGSAGLGLETVKRALDRKHQVTVLSRSGLDLSNAPNLISIQGSATNKAALKKSLATADAAIVTLGTRKNMKATTLFSDFSKLLVEIQQETSSEIPFLIVTGFGVGESKNYVNWMVKLFLKYFLKDVYSDKLLMEEIITSSKINWLILRPGQLLDKPLTEKYRIETSLYKGIKIGGTNRADIADYLVKQAENPTELGKFVAISNR